MYHRNNTYSKSDNVETNNSHVSKMFVNPNFQRSSINPNYQKNNHFEQYYKYQHNNQYQPDNQYQQNNNLQLYNKYQNNDQYKSNDQFQQNYNLQQNNQYQHNYHYQLDTQYQHNDIERHRLLSNRVLINPYFLGNHQNEPSHTRNIHFNPKFLARQTVSQPLLPTLQNKEMNNHTNETSLTPLKHTPVYAIPSTTAKSGSRYKLVHNTPSSVKKNCSIANKMPTQIAAAGNNKPIRKITKYKITQLPKSAPVPVLQMKIPNQTVIPRKLSFSSRNNVNPKKSRKLVSVNKTVTIRGSKFALTGNSLKLINTSNAMSKTIPKKLRVAVNGKMYVPKSKSILVRETIRDVKKLKKNNLPCPIFRKNGKCLRNLKKICQYVHDRKHVVLCRKFLKGACKDPCCLLSHELSKQKMPTCSFYLQGSCFRDSCPYLHVKLSDKADVCKDFLNGYCEKGEECNKRHSYILCPNLSKKGKCNIKFCPYPHKCTTKNLNKKLNPENTMPTSSTSIHSTTDQTIDVGADHVSTENVENLLESQDSKRYFIQKQQIDDSTVEVVEYVRHKLGSLPSFIKL